MMKQCWVVAIICVFLAGLADSRDDDLVIPRHLSIGAGSSAYQVEGAWNVSGKSESIWDRMVHTHPKTVRNGSNGDVACDSYHKYKEDVQLMKSVGMQNYRFSISWTRVVKPGCANEVNEAGLEYYKNLVTELIRNNIQPIVTIYHWDHPQYMEDFGGWTNELMVDRFVTFARILFEGLGDNVKIWQTMNEPNIFCTGAYGGNVQPHLAPGKSLNRTGIYLCMHNILKAHASAYHVYDKEFRPTQHGEVSIGPSCDNFRGVDPNDTASVETAFQFDCGWIYHPIYHGDYPKIMKERLAMISKAVGCKKSLLPEFSDEWIKRIKGTADFFGVNHYTTSLVAPDPDEKRGIYTSDSGVYYDADHKWPRSTTTWLYDVPWGFRNLLRWIKKEYNNPPIRVTENGWGDNGELNDYGRIHYYYGYLRSMLEAVKEDDCNVRSYTMWSLLDDFEFDSGYTWTHVLKPGCANEINEAGIEYYRNLVTELVKNNIRPIATIYHWDHPQYMEDMGGWTNELILYHFLKYARILFERLGDKVKIWQTVNEPNVFCTGTYGGDALLRLAPAKSLNRTGIYLCMHNVLKAHALVYHMYDKEFRPIQHGEVGIGPNCNSYRGVDPDDTASVETAFQFDCGWVYHPIYHGDYPKIMKERLAMISKAEGCEKSVLPEFSDEWIKRIKLVPELVSTQ